MARRIARQTIRLSKTDITSTSSNASSDSVDNKTRWRCMRPKSGASNSTVSILVMRGAKMPENVLLTSHRESYRQDLHSSSWGCKESIGPFHLDMPNAGPDYWGRSTFWKKSLILLAENAPSLHNGSTCTRLHRNDH